MTAYRCAVVIPTKNAMPGLKAVLDMVLAQDTEWPFEVVVIDSGSKDGTKDYVRSLAGVRLMEIPPEDFGHGRTRNAAIAACDAEFVALLTHDATPANRNWLATLVAAAEQDERIAGVFGRHVGYPHASPYVRRDLDAHFNGFLSHPLVVDRETDPQRYADDIGWRQFLHFYSDNNSLMRKSVWENHPYPDVEFAEDQLWARSIIELGFRKAYAPEAVVLHSHDYAPFEQLQRAFDESRNFKKYFGYELSARLLPALAAMARGAGRALCERPDETRYGRVGWVDRGRQALQRIALVAGHFLGANHASLPRSLARRLSRDQQLFDS